MKFAFAMIKAGSVYLSNRSLLLFLLCFIGCKSDIDINNIEIRNHGLRYIKGKNTLVDGRVVRKADGRIIELTNFKDGKMIGDWFQYGDKGQVMSHGFGVEIKSYEKELNGFDLTNCVLSIVIAGRTEPFTYATLYMDNNQLFNNKEKLVRLANAIFSDYSNKYKLDDLLIFDSTHEYRVTKKAATSNNYVVDTIPNPKFEQVDIH